MRILERLLPDLAASESSRVACSVWKARPGPWWMQQCSLETPVEVSLVDGITFNLSFLHADPCCDNVICTCSLTSQRGQCCERAWRLVPLHLFFQHLLMLCFFFLFYF